MTDKPRNVKEFEDFILSQVVIESEDVDQDPLQIRVDVLDRILELLRFHNALGANKTSLRDVLRAGFKMDGKLIRYRAEGQEHLLRQLDPKRPSDLQVQLLVFLLCNYISDENIFFAIERFIGKIHPTLSPLDFERTMTGTMRCYTNTRFASVDLRSLGLLKVTEKELFKTWELSFLGAVVAVSAYEDCVKDKRETIWNQVGKATNKFQGGIYNFVCNDAFVSRAERVMTHTLSAQARASGADVQLSALRALVEKYQATCRDTKLKAAERTRILTSISAEIEQLPGMMERLRRMASPEGRARDFKFDLFIKAFGQSQN